ncbi:uncharacterized protein BXZ73DRAFT_100572 [Epithele typhae]|uniref:uncharacterized protein n=1 Tax=Epithele typhae TaxID=378194 RepID=UPI002008799E|nr:uncharacterized protein BXZ73DRAFT_100572 [Epithele typhae]KAH9935187.1 hypothetical protein BXZ73DRAFT_100572 [Epithele typhae]
MVAFIITRSFAISALFVGAFSAPIAVGPFAVRSTGIIEARQCHAMGYLAVADPESNGFTPISGVSEEPSNAALDAADSSPAIQTRQCHGEGCLRVVEEREVQNTPAVVAAEARQCHSMGCLKSDSEEERVHI